VPTDCVQGWVVATDIRIVLNRINTFRDEVFGDPNVLRSYFYAISDLAVGGRSVLPAFFVRLIFINDILKFLHRSFCNFVLQYIGVFS